MPVKHPDPFSYSTEGLSDHVNPYVAALREANGDGSLPLAFGKALEGCPGMWRQRVAEYHQRSQPFSRVVVEIGCHLGKTLLEMAASQPDTLFIGLDITFKRVVTTAQRAKAKGLKNVFVILANAASLGQLFAPGELDGVVIFFPDPWIKKARQAKNRLIDDRFCEQLAQALAIDGFCWFKTDHKAYFDASSEHLVQAGLELQEQALPPGFQHDFISTFEQRFKLKLMSTYSGCWRRPEGLVRMSS